MMKRILFAATVMGIAAALIISGCGPKPLKKQSVLDTPDNHYSQGLRELDRGNLDEAAREFQRATGLNKDYAGGYVGMGLVKAAQGDFKAAHDFVDDGISKDKNFLDGYVAKGRIYTMAKKDDDWMKDAVKQFDKALKVDANFEPALYYKGMAYKEGYAFNDAVSVFGKVVALKGDFAARANSEWELVQKIVRAAPGTKVGMKIALMPEIDRADLAVLFIEEMKLLEVLEKKTKKEYDTGFRPPDDPTAVKKEAEEKPAATDIADHWAKNWIKDVLDAGVFELYPDGSFHPDEKITRSNYAQFIQIILMAVTGDESLATKYFGTESRFPDVNSTHYAYNAICLAVDRGIMKANLEGAFGMSKTVSGADALLIIREFQNALRMTF